jgi:hypothetical protein
MLKTSVSLRVLAAMLGMTLLGASCQDRTSQPQQPQPAQTQPVEKQPTTGEQPAIPEPPAPAPTTQQAPEKPAATQPTPASLPASKFDSKPPYPVELHIRSPEDKQPGWLRILGLADKDTPAAVKGVFPEQNRITIDTQNVNRLALQISYLPLAEKKRISLKIDNQGIELIRGNRRVIVLERKRTGEWAVDKTATK